MSRRLSAIHKPPILGYHVMASRAAVAVPWYLAGGVAAANCIAAYQPIGAASYAASKVNLANPGTHDITEISGAPVLGVSGWEFSNDRLSTGIIPPNDQSYSIIMKFSDAPSASATAVGIYDGGTIAIGLSPRSGSDTYYDNGSRMTIASGGYTSGVMCVAGNKAYYNGSAETGTIAAGSGSFSHAIQIGTAFYGSSYFWNGKMAAAAIYSVVLTVDQVAAITAAMAALDGGAKSQSLEGMLSFEPEEEKLWWQGADVDVLAQAQPQPELTWWDKANRVVNAALAKAKKFIGDKLYQLWQALEDYFTYDEEE